VSAAPVAATTTTSHGYAALGDSIAAGVGLAPIPGATPEDTLCGRSVNAYPQLVAAGLHTSLTANVACGGAKVHDLYAAQQVGGTNLAPQIDAAFANGKPRLITLTIGANDLGWSSLVNKCYASTCGTEADNLTTRIARARVQVELVRALLKIDSLSNYRPPKVLVTSYFKPFSDQQCRDTQGLTPDEMNWLNLQENLLDKATRSVASWFNFTSYVPVDFTGHEFCSSTPWIQGLASPAPFHPTVAGQQAIAEAILDATD
jgi:lysophospholipase L1-like esterase